LRLLNIPEADGIVIGAGPNGLAAAIVLAQAGCRVTVVERAHRIGGSLSSAELTLPGFTHDICSSVFPLGIGSPFFRSLPLAAHGLEWIQPDAPLAHPLDAGRAAVLERSLDETAAALGRDGPAWSNLMIPLAQRWDELADDLLAPLRWPKHPAALAMFGIRALRSASSVAKSSFRDETAKALFAGCAAHSMMPLEHSLTAAFGMILAATGHAVGWPYAKGGARRFAEALGSYLQSLGGQIVTGIEVVSLDQLPPAKIVLCDVTPRQLLKVAGDKLPPDYRRQLERYRYGPGAFKVDWALSGPIPWRNEKCLRAGTLHLGGTIEEIAASERAPWQGKTAQRPFVLLAQHSLFDPTRAPAGAHTAWAYCHVPHGSSEDMTERIEAQVERFAPGFGKLILARHTMGPAQLEQHNPNIVGGDINAGVPDLPQLLARPTRRGYATPVRGLYLCSAATPPGGGVHGMCGYFAAKMALERSC
jgi:phytoene dehydrogenase-like protein